MPGGWGQAEFQGAYKVVVLEHRFFISRIFRSTWCRGIGASWLPACSRSVRTSVGDLAPDDEQLEAFGGIGALLRASGEYFDRVIDDEGRLEQVGFGQLLEQG